MPGGGRSNASEVREVGAHTRARRPYKSQKRSKNYREALASVLAAAGAPAPPAAGRGRRD